MQGTRVTHTIPLPGWVPPVVVTPGSTCRRLVVSAKGTTRDLFVPNSSVERRLQYDPERQLSFQSCPTGMRFISRKRSYISLRYLNRRGESRLSIIFQKGTNLYTSYESKRWLKVVHHKTRYHIVAFWISLRQDSKSFAGKEAATNRQH